MTQIANPPTITLRPDYQEPAVRYASEIIQGEHPGVTRTLFGSPTGTGKTVQQVANLLRNPGGIQVVQSPDIAYQFGKTLGLTHPDDRVALERYGVFTYQRLKLLLGDGKVDPSRFKWGQVDEAHHMVDETHELIAAYLNLPVWLGWSATLFRGTAQGTKELLDWWDRRTYTCITLKDAVERGHMALPTFDVWPLVDDELITCNGGEFSVHSVEAHTRNKLEHLAQRTVAEFWSPQTRRWDRPTMVTLTSVKLVEEFVKYVEALGADATPVVGRTRLRQDIFRRVEASETLLVQIKAVGEGTDLKLRRLIDAAPTMSPVFWMQRVGRITRPLPRCPACQIGGSTPTQDSLCCRYGGFLEPAPQYIACNHNFMRHGYLWHGVVPRAALIAARAAWGESYKPSRRAVGRVVGLDGLGRFVPAEVPLKGGGVVVTFQLASPDGREYAVVIDPADPDPVYAERIVPIVSDGEGKNKRDYSGKPTWHRIEALPEVAGMSSINPHALTPNQKQWWDNAAEKRGLDASCKVDNKKFQLLPVLTDLNAKVTPEGIRFR